VDLAQTGGSVKCQSIVEATPVMLKREVRRQVQEVRDRLGLYNQNRTSDYLEIDRGQKSWEGRVPF